MPEIRARGGCLCGAVRYEVRGALRDVVNCHCRMCQRTHGNFAPYTATERESFALVKEDGLAWYESSPIARRGFCKQCGASLFWDPVGKGYIAIAAGSIDPPTGLKTVRHIFLEDQGDYYELHDDLDKLARGHATSPAVS